MISIDGTTGEIFAGELPTIEARFEDEHDLATLLGWADEIRRLQVWANADYPRDAERARASGRRASACAGPSTCSSRRSGCRPCSRMILNATRATEAKRRRDAGDELSADDARRSRRFDAALAELEALQTDDFAGLFRAMDGLPVVIRLIDPPLHEFLPARRAAGDDLLDALRSSIRRCVADGSRTRGLPGLRQKDAASDELMPEGKASRPGRIARPERAAEGAAAGGRGHARAEPDARHARLRLGLMIPDIVRMQTRAILAAAARVAAEGKTPLPEIMIPLVGHVNELARDAARARGRGGEHRRGERAAGRLQVRHHDRGAARRADGRRDRRARRVLQLRHQRPDPDDLRLLAATTPRASSCCQYVDRKILPEQPVPGARPRGRGAARADGRREGPRRPPGPRRSASAASTAATRPASPSATRSGWTTSPARRSGSRSRAWPPPRRRSPTAETRDK